VEELEVSIGLVDF